MAVFDHDGSAMVKKGPIMLVEDNPGDAFLFKQAFEMLEAPNEVLHFGNGLEALNYLRNTNDKPFIILSDINMPRMNGLELKKEIDKDEVLKMKAIPFIFTSSSAARKDIYEAFGAEAQGYFEKPIDINVMISQLKLILEYWNTSELPAYY